jgi:DNA-binding LacI/PurR family transcriptional regulator
MYQQLRQDLLARIRRGEFTAGDLLPSENRLCERYEVSVTTARRALLELVKEGIVYRKAGVGTMVASRVRQVRLAFLSIDYRGDAWRRTPSAMGEIVAGLGAACWQRAAAFSMQGVEREAAVTHLRGLVEERSADGVLLRTADDIDEELLEVLETGGMPYATIKRHVPGRRMNCVVSDDVSGARMATDHLLDLGHRQIGFVCAKPRITFARERLAGYRAALAERNVEPEGDLIRQRPYFTTEEGYRATRELLELPSPPTAVFVASDTMALGAYRAIGDMGLRIPGDVSLVGYDDISPSAVLQPPLTTVRTSYYDFGRLAADLLLDIVEGRETAPRQRIIEPALVVRDSTRENGGTVVAPRRGKKAPAATEPPGWRGRLSGRDVAIIGSDAGMVAGIRRACEAEGALVVDDGGRAAILFYCFRAGPDLGSALDQAAKDVEAVLRELPSGIESAVYIVRADGPADALEFVALRAGLGHVVQKISKVGTGAPRVNAVMLACDGPQAAAGPAMFMALEVTVKGEVLVLGKDAGVPART